MYNRSMKAKNTFSTEVVRYAVSYGDVVIRKVNRFTGEVVFVGTRNEWANREKKPRSIFGTDADPAATAFEPLA